MKLGDFISHRRLFGKEPVKKFLKTGFSRISDKVISELPKAGGFKASILNQTLTTVKDEDMKLMYKGLQDLDLKPPATNSVISIGEETLAQSIQRIGEIDFFSVVTRRPTICDFKPVQVEVAVARLVTKSSESEETAQVLRFANRVPLQFDKAGCAIVKAINSVNWKTYGLRQSKGSIPVGPYIIAVSVVSPFIKFKNASKETIDASDELVEEIRRALMKTGQKLSRHLKREHKEAELEEKIAYIEKFAPILVEILCRITDAPKKRKEAAEKGLEKILGRDTKATEKELSKAEVRLAELKEKSSEILGRFTEEELEEKILEAAVEGEDLEKKLAEEIETKPSRKSAAGKKAGKKAEKKTKTKKKPAVKKTTKAKKKVVKKAAKKKPATKKKSAAKKKAAKKKVTKKTKKKTKKKR
jgi:DNA topoisomerase-6 subunit B